MEIQEKTQTINASLDEIAQMWLNIILAQIRSNKEQENLKDKQKMIASKKGGGK